ncbi:MAG: heme exporter protein CcmB [Gammaproteobacteria bacterium]|nr:heme exporter protein CcmB [Pseudomonadota bacterium]TDJ27558.1 MAG: heme exporter protein CcmB [Gammaproteobacteria bacterium]
MSLTQAFVYLLRRDLTLAYRNRAEFTNPLLFFVLVISLFPLAIGPSPALLQSIAPGIIWVAALLAAMLSLDSIFRSDFDDGSLEQLLLSAHPVPVLVMAKVCAHWLVTGAPLLLIAPVLAEMLGMPSSAQGVLFLTILIGTPILSLLGSIGVALTVGLPKGGIILSILVLPLYVPVLIFAASAITGAVGGLNVSAQIYMLLAFLFLALSLSPWATAAALRMSMS